MENYAYALVVVGWINIFFGVYTWQAAKSSQSVRFFAGSLFSVGLWGIGLAGFLGSNNPDIALIWAKFHYVASIYVAYFLLLFGITLTRKDNISLLKQILLHLPILAVVAVTIFSQTLLLKSVSIEETGNVAILFKPGHIVYGAIFAIYFALSLVIILVKMFKAQSLARKQLVIVFVGLLLTGILGAVFNLILPIIGNYKLIWVGPLFTILFLGITLIGILRYQLFNIRLLAGKVLFIGGSSILIYGTFLALSFINKLFFKDILSWEAMIFGVLASVIFVIFYEKFSKYIQQSIQNNIINPDFDAPRMLQEYNAKLAKIVLKVDVLRTFADVVRQTISPEYFSMVMYEEGELRNKQYIEYRDIAYRKIFEIIEKSPELQKEYVSLATIVSAIQTNRTVVSEDITNLAEVMQTGDIHLLIPVIYDNKLLALCMLGKRDRNGNTYIEDETEFLESLASITGISLTRAVLYEQVEDLNKTLQQKVDLQTKELQVKIVELQEARQKENDMIDIMGHELRTPATVVKLNAQLLDKFDKEIESDPQAYKRYVDRIKTAVENEIKLINTLLSSAKLEGNKIVIEPEEIDIKQEIEMAIHGNEKDAKDKNLPIINNVDQNTPNVYADKARVVEVLNNLVSNGVKYTDTGSVTVSSTYNEAEVEITVADTGRGIAKEDLPKLGQKFYRTGNYIDSDNGDAVDIVRPGGTGLGLFVTFNLIRKMGGDVRVESELGKGSKFIFTLPRYNGQNNGFHKTQSNDMFEKLGLKK